MKDALVKLLKIKSIVTILLILTFVVGSLIQQIMGQAVPDPLINLCMIVVGFYYGTQSNKKE